MNLSQNTAAHAGRYQDLHLTVDFEREMALLDGIPMKLTHKAYSLLAFLCRHPGELVPRETLLSMVWGYGAEIRTRTLDVHVRRLRKNLGSYSHVYVETIFGVGYRFQPYRATPVRELAAGSVGTPAVDASPASWRWKMAGAPAI
jgi:DNA-binding response OmpR family regulator